MSLAHFTEQSTPKKEPAGSEDSHMVISAGVEPAIFWMRTRRPRPLDDETKYSNFTISGQN